ncbi:MAG: nickel pincer cofactor biosynthesis protein LarC [Syntrophobacteraceae bacterium]
MNIAYLDCFSGISGDMALGALVDIGVPVEALVSELRKLPLEKWSLGASRERRGAIEGVRVVISAGDQPHRHLSDIEDILGQSGLDAGVMAKSIVIFERIARAEGRVHGIDPSEVHFHEVGAVDSILDIVGTIFCLRYLNIEKVYASPVPVGGGFVKTAHGSLPLPAPATAELLTGVPIYGTSIERELVTPTGAAILAALAESFGPAPSMTLLATGYGAGAHPADNPPNLLRILYGKAAPALLARDLLVIETSIDDMNPEIYNYVIDKLFALGVLDVNLVPVQMKKNRPGVVLRVLVEPGLESATVELLLNETTTLGVRVQGVKRIEVPREERTISTSFGPVRVKRVLLPNGGERVIPEYEECRRIADKTGMPLPDVYRRVLAGDK